MEWNVWHIIAGPLLGAVIGYITNKIAVDMLFWPVNPVFIGKFHVPFTPGIIPKGKNRFGKAVGEAVGKNLLPPSIIKNSLLSKEMELELSKHLDLIIQSMASDQTTLDIKIRNYINESKWEYIEAEVIQVLTQRIQTGILSMDLGNIIANEVKTAVRDRISGTMIEMFLQPPVIESMEDDIRSRINEYIVNNGEEKISNLIRQEYKDFMTQTTLASIADKLDSSKIKTLIFDVYRLIVDKYIEKFLSVLDFSKIVEVKIKAMDTREMEGLVLVIMKNELGAVVKLGALIGFVLGLINLMF